MSDDMFLMLDEGMKKGVKSTLTVILREYDIERLAKGDRLEDSVGELRIIVEAGNPSVYGTGRSM